MRHQGTDRYSGIETALRDILRDVVRDELRYLREDILVWIKRTKPPHRPSTTRAPTSS
jgi:hypothetical protein